MSGAKRVKKTDPEDLKNVKKPKMAEPKPGKLMCQKIIQTRVVTRILNTCKQAGEQAWAVRVKSINVKQLQMQTASVGEACGAYKPANTDRCFMETTRKKTRLMCDFSDTEGSIGNSKKKITIQETAIKAADGKEKAGNW